VFDGMRNAEIKVHDGCMMEMNTKLFEFRDVEKELFAYMIISDMYNLKLDDNLRELKYLIDRIVGFCTFPRR
jgi:hypothetical protein